MNLFVVIAVYNRRDITLQCLSQLNKQSFRHFSIVVVDDGSTDGTPEAIVNEYPDVAIVKGPGSWWWTRSMNEGIRYAINHGASAVLTMNNDTFFDEKYIEKMKQCADENPGALIGSLDITMEEPHRIFFSGVERMIWWKAKYIKYHNNYDLYDPTMTGLHKSVCLNGRGTWVPVDVYHKIGLLDEARLPQYASDFDFSLRADEAGIDTWISWDAVLYSYVKETGTGKPFIKQGFGVFLRSFFSQYSQTSLTTLYAYFRKHCKWYYFLFAYLLQILKLFYSYFKRRNAFA